MIERARKRLSKRAKRGFRGWPLATVALYGPDNTMAAKLTVGILPGEDADLGVALMQGCRLGPASESLQGREETGGRRGARGEGAGRWWFRRRSVRMFNLLLSDCGCPRVLSFPPDRVVGLLKIGISEHPYSDCDQLGALLGFPENRSPTFWAKIECHSSTAICSTRISFGDARSDPDLLSRIECLNAESASGTALAFEAVAHGDADGVASNCYLELSATACGFAIRHVDYLSTETRNSIRASAQFLVSHDAGREWYVQQKGVSRLPLS